MLLLQLTKGALVPHAPLLLPQLASEETRSASGAIGTAVKSLKFDDYELLVIVSPHGRQTGVYRKLSGSLKEFGYPGIMLRGTSAGDIASSLADAWRQSLVDDPIDHGVLVPLALHGPTQVPVIAVSFQDSTTFDRGEGRRIEDEARALAAAIPDVVGSGSVLFVASANDSAGLSARAPLTELPRAGELRDELHRTLAVDVGKVDGVALQLFEESGSCGLGPLLTLAELFAARKADVLAREQPVGVGYTVAVTDD